MPACPLCQHRHVSPFHRDQQRTYQRCNQCCLVFVDAHFHLSEEQEKAEYDLHRNSPLDPGYRQFLGRLVEPLLQRLPDHSRGLDFGCGPGPTLSVMLEEHGHRVALYDYFYARDESVWQQQYHFITATEVVEHLSQPHAILPKLWSHLQPGGVLGIMTKLVKDRDAFANWHYRNDPTHISFFSRETFLWLGEQWNAAVEFIGADVILISARDTGNQGPVGRG